MRFWHLLKFTSVFALICLTGACVNNARPALAVDRAQQRQTDLFINPQPVEISGYHGSAMEPFISPDGKFLFFNTDDTAEAKAKTMHFAIRTGPLSFRYLGELPGVNAPMSGSVVAAAPSLDTNGNFFFSSMRQYDKDSRSVFVGHFDGQSVTDVYALDGNITDHDEAGTVNMDVSISLDGDTLYISRTHFNPLMTLLFHSAPTESHLLIAHREGNKFILDAQSGVIMKNLASSALTYAPDISPNGLELYFTRASEDDGVRIMVASRASLDKPFDPPCALNALTGFVEGPSISSDGQELFFHKKVNKGFAIFVARRNPAAANTSSVCH